MADNSSSLSLLTVLKPGGLFSYRGGIQAREDHRPDDRPDVGARPGDHG